MSGSPDLAAVGTGFASLAIDSQRVFRGALEALAHPGRIVSAESGAAPPSELHHAAAAIALALLDQDTRLWLSPSFSSDSGTYLRFHTGCVVVADCAQADFALVDSGQMPSLDAFASGSEEYPDRSATVIVQVEDISAVGGWRLSGPGIEQAARLAVRGLAPEFVAQWTRQRLRFPRGIDVYLACGSQLCGLPRTVRIEA